MGRERWNTTAFTDAVKARKAAGIDDFAFSKTTLSRSGSLHPDMDPSLKDKRLSLYPSADKPTTSVTIAIDVTGSGGAVPGIIQNDLPQLMGLLSVEEYVQWPNIQIMGIGDVYSDDYPLQVSQFEADIKIDDCLRSLVLEGGGGGTMQESYEIALWYAANMNQLQSWEDGRKGFLFIVGDEMPYPTVKKEHIQKLIGTEYAPQADLSLEQVMQDVLEKYHVYYIICQGSAYYNDPRVINTWKNLLANPQNVIRLPRADDISETCAGIVGIMGGVPIHKITSDLRALGSDMRTVDTVTTALAAIDTTGITHHPKQQGSSSVLRL